jgi:hypothetical protein
MKSVYDVNTLDLQQVAKSFGFRVAPFVDIGKKCKFNFKIPCSFLKKPFIFVEKGVSAGKNFASSKRKAPLMSDKKAKKAKIYKNISKTDNKN